MEKSVFAKALIYLKIIKEHVWFSIISLFFLFALTSCTQTNKAVIVSDAPPPPAPNIFDTRIDPDVIEIYQNSSEALKGAIVGGAAGAIAGGLTTGVGALAGASTGAILGASYGSYVDSTMTLEDKLEKRGVKVIILGDQVLMVLRSSHIFDDFSANIKPEGYSTLRLIEQFINKYTKTLVRVNTYTDRTGSPDLDLALSQQQADRIVKAFSKLRLNARLLYGSGMGGCQIVTQNDLSWDSDNYRIEISFVRLHV